MFHAIVICVAAVIVVGAHFFRPHDNSNYDHGLEVMEEMADAVLDVEGVGLDLPKDHIHNIPKVVDNR